MLCWNSDPEGRMREGLGYVGTDTLRLRVEQETDWVMLEQIP